MKSVVMLIDTAYRGPRQAGDIISVPDEYATRWSLNGIARVIEEVKAEEAKVEEVEDISGMTAKELYDLCGVKGLDVEAKKPKAYYLEALAL